MIVFICIKTYKVFRMKKFVGGTRLFTCIQDIIGHFWKILISNPDLRRALFQIACTINIYGYGDIQHISP